MHTILCILLNSFLNIYITRKGYGGGLPPTDRAYLGDLQHQNTDLQRELAQLKRELELTNQKLGSSMHSIKTFWSPELKKERALRKEESAKYSLINDQLKLLSTENQVRFTMLLYSVSVYLSIKNNFLEKAHFFSLSYDL